MVVPRKYTAATTPCTRCGLFGLAQLVKNNAGNFLPEKILRTFIVGFCLNTAPLPYEQR
jgi:hypothetical protein